MTTATRTTVAPDLAALEHRADYLEHAASTLEARHAAYLREAARALRDSWESGGKQGGKVRVRGARNVQQGDATMRENDRRQGYQVNAGSENSWHYIDGQRRNLDQYAALYLDHLRGEPEAMLVPVGRFVGETPDDLLADLDIAHDCTTRAAIDRRIVAVLMADPDDWTIDPADRELAEQEQVAAIVAGADLVDAVAARVGAPPMPEPAEPAIPDGATAVIGYCRVSTEDQEEEGHGLDAQEHSIREAARAKGWHVVRIDREVGSGRSTTHRPLLRAALDDLDAMKGPRSLVVARLDRMARSVVDGARIIRRSNDHGWSVVALDVGMDTTTANGRMMANMMLVTAEWYRDIASEATRAGMAAAKRNGPRPGKKAIGRPRTMPQAMVERLVSMRSEGLSYRRIAATLNDEGTTGPRGGTWTDVTVAKAIRRWGTTDAAQSAASPSGEVSASS